MKWNAKISLSDNSYISFPVDKFVGGTLIWSDKEAADRLLENKSGKNWSDDSLASNFSYAVRGNRYFKSLNFQDGATKMALAEVYPAGANGGGARAGNLNGAQVKGIGQNPVIGDHDDLWHSYGGFSLVEASLEVINSIVLEKVLPKGCIKPFALIYTGPKSALTPTEGEHTLGPGAILVREKSVRPAHFFPLNGFIPKKKYKKLFKSEKRRVRDYFSPLSKTSVLPVISETLESFYENVGSQFAFSKMNRIYHGAMNYTNISIDGRWLDLTTADFVDSGSNYGEGRPIPCFYKEHCTLLNYANGFCDLLERYGTKHIDPNHFKNSYFKSFEEGLVESSLGLFGVPSEDFYRVKDTIDYSVNSPLFLSLWDSIVCDSSKSKPIPVEQVIEETLQGLLVGESNSDMIKHLGFILERCFSSIPIQMEYNDYLVLSSIRAFKKTKFRSMFSREFHLNNINNLLADPVAVGQYIKDVSLASEWVFESLGGYEEIIFKSETLEVGCSVNKGLFIRDELFSWEGLNVDVVKTILSEKERKSFVVCGCDFYEDILSILDKIFGNNF